MYDFVNMIYRLVLGGGFISDPTATEMLLYLIFIIMAVPFIFKGILKGIEFLKKRGLK